jgi:hypothetical protein
VVVSVVIEIITPLVVYSGRNGIKTQISKDFHCNSG